MEEFDIYYSDGNHRIITAEGIVELMEYLIHDTFRDSTLITKILQRGGDRGL